jgi:hypothetical protein
MGAPQRRKRVNPHCACDVIGRPAGLLIMAMVQGAKPPCARFGRAGDSRRAPLSAAKWCGSGSLVLALSIVPVVAHASFSAGPLPCPSNGSMVSNPSSRIVRIFLAIDNYSGNPNGGFYYVPTVLTWTSPSGRTNAAAIQNSQGIEVALPAGSAISYSCSMPGQVSWSASTQGVESPAVTNSAEHNLQIECSVASSGTLFQQYDLTETQYVLVNFQELASYVGTGVSFSINGNPISLPPSANSAAIVTSVELGPASTITYTCPAGSADPFGFGLDIENRR